MINIRKKHIWILLILTLIYSALLNSKLAFAALSLPTVTTSSASTSLTSATLYGSLDTNGGANVTDCGFKWGTSTSSLTNTASVGYMGATKGAISKTISGLQPGKYYYKAYATNSVGTAYGSSVLSFTISLPTPTVTLTGPANNSRYTVGTPITITATGTNCNHMNAFINGVATGNTIVGNKYSWNYTPTAAGTYTICVKGRNTAGETDAGTQLAASATVTVVVVNLPPTPTVTLTGPANNSKYTVGTPITISATGTNCDHMNAFINGAATGNTIAGNKYTWNYTPTAAGTYTICVKGRNTPGETDPGTQLAASTTVTVTVANLPPIPTVTLTAPVNNSKYTVGTPITITATGTNCNHMNAFINGVATGDTIAGNKYTWNFTPTAAGTYTICVKGRNTLGETDTGTLLAASTTVTVVVVNLPAAPTVTLTDPVNSSKYIVGTPITIAATGTNCDHMNAFINGAAAGNTIAGNNYSWNYTPTTAGTYTICVKGRNTPGETDPGTQLVASTTVTVTVVNLPPAPTVTLTGPANSSKYTVGTPITITAAGTNCNHMNAFINGTATGDTIAGNKYSWNFTPTAAGTYTICVKGRNTLNETDPGTQLISSTTVTVSVVNLPAAPTVTLTGPVSSSKYTVGTPITITATGTNCDHMNAFINGAASGYTIPGNNYSWDFIPTTAGTYTICVKGRNTPNETDAGTQLIKSTEVTVTVSAATDSSGQSEDIKKIISNMPNNVLKVGSDYYSMNSNNFNDSKIAESMSYGPQMNSMYFKTGGLWYDTLKLGDDKIGDGVSYVNPSDVLNWDFRTWYKSGDDKLTLSTGGTSTITGIFASSITSFSGGIFTFTAGVSSPNQPKNVVVLFKSTTGDTWQTFDNAVTTNDPDNAGNKKFVMNQIAQGNNAYKYTKDIKVLEGGVRYYKIAVMDNNGNITMSPEQQLNVNDIKCTNAVSYSGTNFHFVANIFNYSDLQNAVVLFRLANGDWQNYEDNVNNAKFKMNRDSSVNNSYFYSKDVTITESGLRYYKIAAKDISGRIIESPIYQIEVKNIINKGDWIVTYDSQKDTIEALVNPQVTDKNWSGMPRFSLVVSKVMPDNSLEPAYFGTEDKMVLTNKLDNGKYDKIWNATKSDLYLVPGQTYRFSIMIYYAGTNTILTTDTIDIKINGAIISNGKVIYTYYNTTLEAALNIQMQRSPKIETGGVWVDASKGQVQQYLDPSNYDDGDYIYQYLDLASSAGVSLTDMSNFLSNKGILAGKASNFMNACNQYGVSEVYAAAHAALETGNGTSQLSTGVIVNGVKVYNMFGINAVDSDPVGKGSQYAYASGWTTPELAIEGGIKWISAQYINNASYKQNTLYKMRWNPAVPGTHQYATDVAWAVNQIYSIKNLFKNFPNAILNIDIPVYK